MLFNEDSAIGQLFSALFSKSGVIIIGSLLSALIIACKFPVKDKEDK